MRLYILPNQLYHIKINNITECIIWEHPKYFTEYQFNKKKLLLHRASMKMFCDTFLKKTYKVVRYINFNDEHKVLDNSIMFEPLDTIKEFNKCKKIESPNFLLNIEELKQIYSKQGKTIRFTQSFFKQAKKEKNILVDVDSTDKQNRVGKIPEEIRRTLKALPKISRETEKYVKEAIPYVEKHFSNNYGNVANFIFPISKTDALKWLDHFVKHSFQHFGKYQDAIVYEEVYLFHSVLSSSLNIGLIHPTDIMERIEKSKDEIPLNSYEGFVRQLFWREYQRYNYIFNRNEIETPKLFDFKTSITESWYKGDLGILPVDTTIKKAFDSAYLHHIERLMIIGNYMVLNKIKPYDGYKWFMEFAIDSYEWVMLQNVYDMVFFNSNGMTTTKLYITSSNYILNNTDYKKDGKWEKKWNELYKSFKKSHFINLYKYKN